VNITDSSSSIIQFFRETARKNIHQKIITGQRSERRGHTPDVPGPSNRLPTVAKKGVFALLWIVVVPVLFTLRSIATEDGCADFESQARRYNTFARSIGSVHTRKFFK